VQIPDEIRKCVCFLTARRNGEAWLGSGAFLSVPLGFADWNSIFVATARHCIEPLEGGDPFESISLRLNTLNGSSEEVETDPNSWIRHPVADVAILPIAPDQRIYDYLHYSLSRSATKEFMAEKFVGPGEEVVITGLLTYHPGTTRILPIVRVGNIAALPDEPVSLVTGPDDAVLVEVRSIGGLSGSPAFVHMPEMRRDRDGVRVWLPDERQPESALGGSNYFLGVVHGYPLTQQNDPDGIGNASPEPLNTGITVVVPVEKVLELVDDPAFVALRDVAREGLEAKSGDGLDTAEA
jgi:hypothetical protein